MIKRVLHSLGAAALGVTVAGNASAMGPTPDQFFEWATWYTTGDMRADFNGDGQLNSADFGAFLQYHENGGQGNNGGGDESGGGGDDTKPDDGVSSGGDDDSAGGDDDADDGGGGPNGGGGDGSGGPDSPNVDGEGWTKFSPSRDTVRIYVSASGNDRFDGRTPQTAVRSIARGKDLIRDGMPDWLLLKAGDTFNEPLGGWDKSGRSAAQPMLVSSYGQGARPRIITDGKKALTMYGYRDFRRHVAFVGLHLEPGRVGSNDGISIVSGNVEDILFEDNYIANFSVNVVVGGVNGNPLENVRFRRNIIVDASGQERSHGIYAEKLEGLLVEENMIDRNGWDYRRGREATATIWGHNVYIQKTAQGVIARGNISSRSSSHGWQSRTGGVQENNLYARNPIGFLFANDRSKANNLSGEIVRGNLVVEGVHTNNQVRRGWGIHLSNIRGAIVTDNIVANSLVPDSGWGISVSGSSSQTVSGTVIQNNIVDDYGHAFRVLNDVARDVRVRGNTFVRSSGELALVDHKKSGRIDGLRYEGNRYMYRGSGLPFETGSRKYTFGQWRNLFDANAASIQGNFVDENRSLDSYARSIGLNNANALFDAMRRQSRTSFDERLTAEAVYEYFKNGYTLN